MAQARKVARNGGAPGMVPQIFDTYSFLLDNPDRRHLAFEPADIEYMTPDFSQAVYEENSGRTFSTREEAYRDWVATGRGEGIPYQTGKNTYLKIILKVKDEPELLRQWIGYHAEIVGYHNIIVMDCGSADPAHIAILEEYKSRILVLKYPRYYDVLHSTVVNADFYRMISGACKFVTVLDADEFLFCYDKGEMSKDRVVDTIKNGSEDIYAGTWFFNTAMPEDEAGNLDFGSPISFFIDHDEMVAGTVTGKSIVRSSLYGKIKHIGHNLVVPEVVSFMRLGSFGVFGVFHLRNLNFKMTRSRALKHLCAKGIVPREAGAAEVEQRLKALLVSGGLRANELFCAKKYLGLDPVAVNGRALFTTNLLGGIAAETSAEFSNAIEHFDFDALLRQQRARHGL